MATKRAKAVNKSGKPDGRAGRKVHRDTSVNDAKTAEAIGLMQSDGLPAARACLAIGLKVGTFYEALKRNAQLAESYARAQKIVLQRLADEMLSIADDGSNDTYIDENGNVRTNTDVVQRSRLRVDTRKWLLSKLVPRVYGDHVELEHTGTVTETRRVVLSFEGLTAEQQRVAMALAAGPKRLPAAETTARERDPGYTPTAFEEVEHQEPDD